MATSLVWSQLLFPHPEKLQCRSCFSFPLHATPDNQIGPLPPAKWPLSCITSAGPNPSSLQTTFASTRSQELLQTVPQTPLYRISTRPDRNDDPFASRRKGTAVTLQQRLADTTV